MRRSTYITQTVWRKISPDLRRAILNITGLRRTDIVSKNMFISDIISMLHSRGEHALANELLLVHAITE